MSSTPEPERNAAVVPIGPSLVVRLVMRPLSRILDPLVAKLAGRRGFPMVATIHHVGRRSGKTYTTPAGARVQDGNVLIPLTFGNQSDWARNIRAAGSCSVRANGQTYQAVRPHLVESAAAAPRVRASFGPIERVVFKLIGIKQFMQLEVVSR